MTARATDAANRSGTEDTGAGERRSAEDGGATRRAAEGDEQRVSVGAEARANGAGVGRRAAEGDALDAARTSADAARNRTYLPPAGASAPAGGDEARSAADARARTPRHANPATGGKRTLADDAYAELKARIMRSELAPGAKLSIDGMAKELAFSQTPIREALARLESEGLLARRPLSGYTVEPLLSAAEFADLFDLRMMLEPLAARRAAERLAAEAGVETAERGRSAVPGRGPAAAAGGTEPVRGSEAAAERTRLAAPELGARNASAAALGTDSGLDLETITVGPEALADVTALLEAARTPHPSADKLEFTEADRRFHDAVATFSGSVQIAKAIRRLDAHLHLHRAYIAPESIEETEAEHLAVAEAIMAMKPLAAEAAMRRHLERSRVRHAAAFTAANPETAPKPKRAKANR